MSAPAPRRAFLALGSNLGDRWANLRQAADALPDVVARSSVYETDPVGGPDNQGPYLNAVLELRTSLSARQLLEAGQAAERRAQRVRNERWGPRTLDVDVLWVEGESHDEEDLVVPHPRMWERDFVLIPLGELAPDLVTPDPITGAPGAPGQVEGGQKPNAPGTGVRRAGSL